MEISEFLSPDDVFLSVKVKSRKQLLQKVSELCAKKLGLEEIAVFEALFQRERLGSTGLGNGIAVPHGKLTGIEDLFGMFIQLREPIEFDAVDGQPVDLFFVLLAPENSGAEHLKALAKVARVLREGELVSQLRSDTSSQSIFALLTDSKQADAA